MEYLQLLDGSVSALLASTLVYLERSLEEDSARRSSLIPLSPSLAAVILDLAPSIAFV